MRRRPRPDGQGGDEQQVGDWVFGGALMSGAMRTCLGCRQKKPKAEMARLVIDAAGRLTWDPGQRLAGRGVYCCKSALCWQRFLKNKKSLCRALRVERLIQEDVAIGLSGVNDEEDQGLRARQGSRH